MAIAPKTGTLRKVIPDDPKLNPSTGPIVSNRDGYGVPADECHLIFTHMSNGAIQQSGEHLLTQCRLFAARLSDLAMRFQSKSILALLVGLLLVNLPAQAQNSPAQSKPFIVGVDTDIATYLGRWTWLIYAEAFKRMGIPLKFNSYPLQRLSAMVDDGAIDGEAGRVVGYGATHPNLVRVEESLLELNFSLYTAHPTLRLQRKDEQSFSGLRVEYRRGILMCETTLKRWVAPEWLSDVTTVEQGVNKLQSRRTDLYCDLDIHIVTALHTPEFKGVTTVRKVLDLSTSVPIYPYLHRKHAELAPRMAATLKAMKAEGLITAYRLQAEHELGWTR